MLGKTLAQLKAELSNDDKHYVEARGKEIVDEFLTLQELRKARHLTQKQLAAHLKINQENVSRMEKRSDLMLSTLASYIEAMGGTLRLTVEFPDRSPVLLQGLTTDPLDIQTA